MYWYIILLLLSVARDKSDDMAALVDELSFFAHIYKQDIQYKFSIRTKYPQGP